MARTTPTKATHSTDTLGEKPRRVRSATKVRGTKVETGTKSKAKATEKPKIGGANATRSRVKSPSASSLKDTAKFNAKVKAQTATHNVSVSAKDAVTSAREAISSARMALSSAKDAILSARDALLDSKELNNPIDRSNVLKDLTSTLKGLFTHTPES